MDPIIAALVTVRLTADSVHRFWTGDYDLSWMGETYLANRILSLDSPGASTLGFGTVLACELNVSGQRDAFRIPVVAATASLTMIGTEDDGADWPLIAGPVSGDLVNASLVGVRYSFQIAPRNPEADRGIPLVWSHSDRVQLVGPRDQGMSQLDLLVNGGIVRYLPGVA